MVDSRARGTSGLTYINRLVLIRWDFNGTNKRDSGTSLIEFIALELLLVLGARNLDTVNNDGRVLREEVADGIGVILLVGGFDDRGDAALGP